VKEAVAIEIDTLRKLSVIEAFCSKRQVE
jgi:hypothetical protein